MSIIYETSIMAKKSILISLFITILFLAGFWFVQPAKATGNSLIEDSLFFESWQAIRSRLSQITSRLTQNYSPEIISASVEPDKVYPGDTMVITVQIKDKTGIKKVIADMGGIETIELELLNGSIYSGTWQAEWLVHSTKPKEYTTIIIATNISGETATKEIKWSDPWLADYNYRKRIPISGSSGAGTNYTVPLMIHSGSGTDSNGVVYINNGAKNFPNDIRFTDNYGETELNYWIKDPTVDPIKIWIKITDDLSSGITNFYIYYGKEEVISESNGDNTFVFFDDFRQDTELNTNKWEESGSPSLSFDETNGLTITKKSGIAHLKTKNRFSFSDKLNLFFKGAKPNIGYYNVSMYITPHITDGDPYGTNNWIKDSFARRADAPWEKNMLIKRYRYLSDYAIQRIYDSEYNPFGSWQKHEIITNGENYLSYYINEEEKYTNSSEDLSNGSYNFIYIFASASLGDTISGKFQYIILRKYTDSEPEVGISDEFLKYNGVSCPIDGPDSECFSNWCVDGFCCNSACDKPCDICDDPGQEGTCILLSPGEEGDCPVCQECDGDGSCTSTGELIEGDIIGEDTAGVNTHFGQCKYCLNGNPAVVICGEETYGESCSGFSVCDYTATCVIKAFGGKECKRGDCDLCDGGSDCDFCFFGYCCDDQKCKGDCCDDIGEYRCSDDSCYTGYCNFWTDNYCSSEANCTGPYADLPDCSGPPYSYDCKFKAVDLDDGVLYNPGTTQCSHCGKDWKWDQASTTNKCCGDITTIIEEDNSFYRSPKEDNWCNSATSSFDDGGSCVDGDWYDNHCNDGVQNCDERNIDWGGVDCDQYSPGATSGTNTPAAVKVRQAVTFRGTFDGPVEDEDNKDYTMYICKDIDCTNCNNSNQDGCWCRSESKTFDGSPDFSLNCQYVAKEDDRGKEHKYWVGVCDNDPYYSPNGDCEPIPFGGEESLSFFVATNVSGWAWSENIGWISFNCIDTDSCGDVFYGVDVDLSTSAFSGYAWSENIGWISFNRKACSDTGEVCEVDADCTAPATCEDSAGNPPADPFQAGTGLIAKLDFSNNEVSGWARALTPKGEPNAGGWDGWIKLKGSYGAGDYGVILNPSAIPAEFEGWAWGGNPADPLNKGVIGWTSFNNKNCDPDEDGFSDGIGNCPSAGTPISDYQVVLNLPPQVSSTSDGFPAPCLQSRIPTLYWEASVSGDYDYQIQIATSSDFSSPEVDAIGTIIDSIYGSWAPGCNYCCNISPYDSIAWGKHYEWQVRIKNFEDSGWSTWKVDDDGFTTFPHCYPYPYFMCSFDGIDWYDCDGDTSNATNPSETIAMDPWIVDSTVYVKDFSLCYDPDESNFPCCDNYDTNTTYTWEILATPTTAIQMTEESDTSATFTLEILGVGDWTINMKVNDKHSPDQICPCSEGSQTELPLPWWKEIIPFPD